MNREMVSRIKASAHPTYGLHPPSVIPDIFKRESSVFALYSVAVVGRMGVASPNMQARMRDTDVTR